MPAGVDFPSTVTLEVSSLCNLRCPYCAVHEVGPTRGFPFIDPALARRLIWECAENGASIWLNFMGEPLLHPSFALLLDWVRESGVNASLESNGTLWSNRWPELLADSALSRIIVTLEPTQELFSLSRKGGNMNQVTESLKRFVARRTVNSPRLELQMILTRFNAHLMADFTRLGKSIGADRSFCKPLMLHQFPGNGNYSEAVLENFWSDDIPGRYVRNLDGGVSLPLSATSSPCPKLEEAVVLSDGRLAMCCYDKGGDYSYGNLNELSLASAWSSARSFRLEIMQKRTTRYCHYCLKDDVENYFWD